MSRIPIGIELDGDGAHPAAWRAADHSPGELLDPSRISSLVRSLDDSGIGFLALPDHRELDSAADEQARLDTVETATFAAAVSSRIGLVPTVNAIHAEPFHLANQLSTLDWASQGRAGWLVRAEDSDDIAAGYGRTAHRDRDTVRAEARDVVAAVRRLWDTWEDDVLIADESTHRFLDLDRWHYADFAGETFTVKGPGLLPRPPQGQLVLWSETLDEVLAPLIDVAVLSARSIAQLTHEAHQASELGVPRRVAAVEVILDARGQRAAERLAALDRWTPSRPGRVRLAGSAGEVAEHLADLATRVDGIRLHPLVVDVDVAVIRDEVLPRLAAAAVLREPRQGETLRDLLGLDRPANVFALAREAR